MTANKAQPDTQIEVQAERLTEEYEGQLPKEEIERRVSESAADLQDAPARQYVPKLVYNEVKDQLVKERDEKQRELA